MRSNLAHIFEADMGYEPWWFIAAATVAVLLVVEHHVVAGLSFERTLRQAVAVIAVTALCVVSTPLVSSASAQSQGALLPDLISDPPQPSFFNELNTADGTTRLVVTFDGYVHNIGEGPLDVVGNPQEPQGMKQRVRNGAEWEIVGSPTVRFETDDGHNHFHLIEVIEYVLWNELQGSQTAIGSKIGFCLVDSEVMEAGQEQSYSEELDKFCEEGNPGATELRMGITPGWRDIYDATTTLQWVDVSNVTPGRYWIGAITDPNNEILESNEDNNDLVFSRSTISVPGFSPRSDRVTVAGEPTLVNLTSSAHGTVGSPVYVIEQGPQFGTLSVPVGADLSAPAFVYTPDAGFEGQDELRFSVRNTASPYPFDAPTQTITLDVDTAAPPDNQPRDGIAPPLLSAPSTFFETSIGQEFEVVIEAVSGDGTPAALHATGLPAGLVANTETGVISGVPIETGFFQVELAAVQGGIVTTQEVTWIINPVDPTAGLRAIADQSSPRGELARVRVGAGALGARYEATGLPDGLTLDATSPLVSGTTTEVGIHDVEIREFDGDDLVGTTSFTWTVRPTTDIDFAL